MCLLLSFADIFFLPPLVRGGGKTVGFDGGVVFEDKLGAPSCNARSDGVAHCATPTTPQFHSLKRSFNSSPDKGSQEFSRPSASERRRSCTATPPDKGSQEFSRHFCKSLTTNHLRRLFVHYPMTILVGLPFV